MPHQVVIALTVGAAVGLASGAFGKGGSALATPLLHALGIPAIVAVASPLPAAIPATAVAARAFARRGFVDDRVVRLGIAFGLPVAAVGALSTRWIPGSPLVVATEILVLFVALRMLVPGRRPVVAQEPFDAPTGRVVGVVVAVSLVSGLLANSGGFLLAPLFVTLLGLPLKRALGTSLAISVFLAVPGTVVHAMLGHVDWSLTLPFAAASVPFARVGAFLSLRAGAPALLRVYAISLAAVSGALLVFAR